MEHSKEFLDIISFENLYKAHRRSRLGKRGKKEVIEFEMNLSENLWALHYDLLYGKYQISGYRRFMIYDPKEREIQAISYRDRIVQHSLCDNCLIPILERRLFYYNVACRKNKGTALAVSALKRFMLKHYKKYGNSGYFIKIDIRKYFDSISHEMLKRKLACLPVANDVQELLRVVIDSYEHTPGRGIPMGNQSSQCFALLYLDCVDRLIKEKLQVKYYVRYMDDMVLIVPDKERARIVLNAVKTEIEAQELNVNPKSQLIAFKNGIEFLGRRFLICSDGKIIQKLKKSAKQRIIKKVRRNVFYRSIGKFSKIHLARSFASYQGVFMQMNAYMFMKQVWRIAS